MQGKGKEVSRVVVHYRAWTVRLQGVLRRHRPPVLMVMLMLAAGGARSEDDVAATAARARVVREVLSSDYGMPPDGIDTRHLAIAAADKLGQASVAALRANPPERMVRDVDSYKPIMEAIQRAKLAPAVRSLLRLRYARAMLWPQRQSAPFIGTQRECRLIAGLPPDTAVQRLAGARPLMGGIQEAYPAFAELNPLQQHLVIRRIDQLNHNVRLEYSLRCKPGEVRERVPPYLGPDLSDITLERRLYRIDETLKPRGYDKGEHPVDYHTLPLGDGTVRLWVYRIRPDGDVILPPPAYLAALSTPPTLDVSNLWLTSPQLVRSLEPSELILDGNAITDLSDLSGMTTLRTLSLQSVPVSDLGPLKELQLVSIDLRDTEVTDLSPLKGMPLTTVVLDRTAVKDLSPLAGAPITHLQLWDTPVSDLRPLARMPLTYLELKMGTVYLPEGVTMLAEKGSLSHISDFPKEQWLKGYALRHSRDWVPEMFGNVERAGKVNRLRYGVETTDH